VRTIQVSTDVFAAMWADRREPEATEDEILRRKFDVKVKIQAPQKNGKPQGFHDRRYNVSCPEGFEIFRVHLGTEYRARAESGTWTLLSTGAQYGSLNELSDATVGHENAWTGWWYLDENGRRKQIDEMRDPSRIRRHKPTRLEDLA